MWLGSVVHEGIRLVINRLRVHWYVASHLGQAFHPSGVGKFENQSVWLALRRGVFTCVRWKVTLCDPIRQVKLDSSEVEYYEELYHLTLTLAPVPSL